MNQCRAKVPTSTCFSLDTGYGLAVLCSMFVLVTEHYGL